MNLLSFFEWLNEDILALPATVLFFGASVLLTFKTGFVQLRKFNRFLSILR